MISGNYTGISSNGDSDTVIEGNYIGTDPMGTVAIGNGVFPGGSGVSMDNAVDDTIGGTVAGAGNLIEGNYRGIHIGDFGSTGNVIEGNDIGAVAGTIAAFDGSAGIYLGEAFGNTIGGATSTPGTGAGNVIGGYANGIALVGETAPDTIEGNVIGSVTLSVGGALPANVNGIFAGPLNGVQNNGVQIGGPSPLDENVISGNRGYGIQISDSISSVVEGNLIGTDLTGTIAVPNGGDGVEIDSGSTGTTIGGTASGAGNVISGNAGDGVNITDDGTTGNLLAGNYIGTDITGRVAIPNANGVELNSGATGNTVGGTALAAQEPVLASTALAGDYLTSFVRLANGDLYILDDQNEIFKLDHATGISSIFSSGGLITSSEAMTLDPTANALIVSNYDNNTNSSNLIKISLADGTQSLLTSGQFLNDGDGIAVEPSGTYVISSWNYQTQTSQVVRVNPTTGAQTLVTTTPIAGAVDGIAVSSQGTIYLSITSEPGPSFTAELVRLDQASGLSTVVSSGGTDDLFNGLTTLSDGNVVVADQVSSGSGPPIGQLVEIDPSTGAQSIISSAGDLVDTLDVIAEPSGDILALNSLLDPSEYAVVRIAVNPARNVISGNTEAGVEIDPSAAANVVAGNLIGTDSSGTVALGNGTGIDLQSSGNTIGGTATGAGNVISGNSGGIGDNTGGNLIEGNFIGTEAGGEVALGNTGDGIGTDASGDTIGGTAAGAGNVISGNEGDGIDLEQRIGHSPAGASGVLIEGNQIGTDKSGTLPIPNQYGVVIGAYASSNTVGGAAAGARNVISSNSEAGIMLSGAQNNIVAGNRIGTDQSGMIAMGNGFDGVELVEGKAYSNIPFTFTFVPATGNTIGGLTSTLGAGAGNVISGNLRDGVAIGIIVGFEMGGPANANVVAGNLIGTDSTGKAAISNGATGVYIGAGSSGNTIGGTADGAGNLISGNTADGVLITAAAVENLVAGNKIGTDISGTVALPNNGGVAIFAPSNTIGGTVSGAGNLISGNTATGIEIVHGYLEFIQGNLIGTDVGGTLALGNGTDGVLLEEKWTPSDYGHSLEHQWVKHHGHELGPERDRRNGYRRGQCHLG